MSKQSRYVPSADASSVADTPFEPFGPAHQKVGWLGAPNPPAASASRELNLRDTGQLPADKEIFKALTSVYFFAAIGDENVARLYVTNRDTGVLVFVEDIPTGERPIHLD